MSIKIYNTLTRKKEEFDPIKKGHVGMYVCGPTVYDDPHIGHARSAYVFDVIRRYFIYKRYKVKFVRNITDVDDKIIEKAKKEAGGSPRCRAPRYPAPRCEARLEAEGIKEKAKEIASRYTKSYHKCMDDLGIRSPDVEPKATEYIGKMKDFIAILIKRGVAYESGGDVYFDVQKAKDYGELSNQGLEMLESGARISPGESKRDPLDFALWKRSKEAEPSWKSPWGDGRPGWHIECSVMSSDILGDEFDIHGGGIDLIFPHHENEFAQSKGAGRKFARYWIHNGLLTINKEKMAKSLGNFVTVEEVLKKYTSDVLKILFLQSHYSHPVDFSWERMGGAKSARERFSILFDKLNRLEAGGWRLKAKRSLQPPASSLQPDIGSFRKQFEGAMEDDFNTPEALAALFDFATYVNREITETRVQSTDLSDAKDMLIELGGILGLFEKKEKVKAQISRKEIEKLIGQRNKARAEKDYKAADKIRERLDKVGIILEDQKGETTWRVK